MRGQVLSFDPMRGEGLISAEDGNRYTFPGTEWRGAPHELRNGAMIDFTPTGQGAVGVYALPAAAGGAAPFGGHSSYPGPYGGTPGAYSGPTPYGGPGPYGATEKSPIVAGLLALFLGGFGVHKFYLGYNTEGAILLGATVASWILLIVLIGFFGLMAIGIICLIEAIIYLTKPQDQFTYTYVLNRKPWF
jgi:TM2 domain-containing membrane protein YozV